jgi:endonuclease/exonuclease/phosphatase (EEP) superfamily protein YafD
VTTPETARRSWDTIQPVPRGQFVLVALAVVALVPAVASTVMRLVPPADDPTVLVASFIAYGLIGYAFGLGCLGLTLLRARRRAVWALLCAVVVALTTLHASWLAPFFVPDRRPVSSPPFTVMSLNVQAGRAASQQVWDQAQQADIVILIEVTPASLRNLERLGWDRRFPYVVGDSQQGAHGTVIFSRLPMGTGSLTNTTFDQRLTTVAVPGIGTVTLMAVHPCNPYCGGNRWAREHAVLTEVAAAHREGPLIMAGDFNAVDDHGPMQALRRLGLESATEVAGAGWLPTWPADRGIPPLIPIDHVLINAQLTATAVRTFAVAHTDHLGVITTLAGAR